MEPNAAGRSVDNPTFRYFLEGIESVSFVLIAGLSKAEAEAELGELLPVALDELGLDCLGYGNPNNDILAAALARSFLYGHLEAQQLTQAIHQTFGHTCHPLVEELSCLDDSFDTLNYVPNPTRDQLVRKTHIAATNLGDKADEIYSEAQS